MEHEYNHAKETFSGETVMLSRTLNAVEGVFTRNKEPFNQFQLIFENKILDIRELSDLERTLFILNKLLGIQQQQVAKLVGISTLSAGQYIDRASRKMGLK
jgi:DNA-directed RNA polymerase specialized sigma subunit